MRTIVKEIQILLEVKNEFPCGKVAEEERGPETHLYKVRE